MFSNPLFGNIGMIKHTVSWALSGFKDTIYLNPHYNPKLGKNITIYCVHGTADRVNAFSFIAKELLGVLPATISSIKLISFDHRGEGVGIETFAAHLRDKIQAYGDKEVILIGHSRGGLVTANFATDLAKAAGIKVRALISICSPFQGSDLAIPPLSWIPTSVDQMKRNSQFLKQVAEKMKTVECEHYYFSAKNDLIVDPDAAYPSGEAHRHIALDRHGHLSIMTSKRLIKYLYKILLKITSTYDKQFGSDSMLANSGSHELSALEDICIDIDMEIERIMSRSYLFAPTQKILVLFNLLKLFREMLTDSRGEYYPKARSIDEFINEFLKDESMGSGRQPSVILSEQLNIPKLCLFSMAQPESKQFITNLGVKYKDVSLPCQSKIDDYDDIVSEFALNQLTSIYPPTMK